MLNETQNILNRLAVADREHQKEAGWRLLLRSVKYVCGAVIAAFVLDVIFHLVAGWRLGIALAMVCGLMGLGVMGWYVAFVRRNRLEHIARFLETRDPALGSRLINLLQLDKQTEDGSLGPMTRELARQAVEKYASELGGVSIESLARTEEVRRYLKKALWTVCGFAAVLGICYRITAAEAARFADPFGDHPPYSFTELEIEQPGTTGTSVFYGTGVIVKVKAMGHQPKEVYLTSYPPEHPEQAVTVPMFDESGAGFNQLLGNVRSDLVVFAHTKDHSSESRQVRVGVVLTPQLEHAYVRIAPPPYTGIRAEEKPYDFKGVQALEGSEVQFRLQSNRPLREGVLEITAGGRPPQRLVLKSTAENEVTGSFIATDSGRLRMGVVDVAGLPSQGDLESGLTVTHDLPPEVRIVNPENDSFAAMDFKLQARIEAGDDYGLREIRFHRGLNGIYSAPRVFRYDGIVLDSRVTADFNFSDLGIRPGDVISFFAEAVDNAPQPHLSRSQTVRLQVISVEDYNNYLREQTDISDTEAKYAQLNDDLQALADRQKELGEEARKLQSQLAAGDPKTNAAAAQQLDRLIARQNELNQKLNQQAERMEHFVREAPLYDVEKELQGILSQKAAVVRQSAQADDASARDVAQHSSPGGGERVVTPEMLQEFEKASDAQAAKLDGAHDDTDKQVVHTLDDMSQMQALQKDFNLFEALYRTQQDLARQAAAYNRPGEMDREDQLALKDLASTEKELGDDLGHLETLLTNDAANAENNFPKAAQSGRDLAEKVDAARMQPLAEQATDEMLAGAGDQSFGLADRLRGEMEKLFTDCQGGNCPGGGELDTYLRLLNMKAGNSFAQMGRSRKFGMGKGNGEGMGEGEGMMGTAGYAVTDGSRMDVLGNETRASEGPASGRQSSRYGKGAGRVPAGSGGEAGTPDEVAGLKPVNRQSAAQSSEAVIEEYNDVVDSYFKAITTKKGKPNP